MSVQWQKANFNNNSCHGVVMDNGQGHIVIQGKLSNTQGNQKIQYWASSPADYITSYSGSGLPFANEEMAYNNSPNIGSINCSDGSFSFKIKYPNSYYTGLGSIYNAPHINIKVGNKVEKIQLGSGIPFRMLTYPPPPGTAKRCSPMFYMGRDRLPVRTQEQICVDSGYPQTNRMPDNFWGLAVPN